MDREFVPETLTWCRQHYVPPVKEHIHCPDFGKSDGMNGSCWWCMEMTPYQWHMCQDESWVRGLLSPVARIKHEDRADAIKFIEEHKQKCHRENEQRNIPSNVDHGTWLSLYSDDNTIKWKCSLCGKETNLPNFDKANFCFNCGSKMDKGEYDND